jgi:hypothetical protein
MRNRTISNIGSPSMETTSHPDLPIMTIAGQRIFTLPPAASILTAEWHPYHTQLKFTGAGHAQGNS